MEAEWKITIRSGLQAHFSRHLFVRRFGRVTPHGEPTSTNACWRLGDSDRAVAACLDIRHSSRQSRIVTRRRFANVADVPRMWAHSSSVAQSSRFKCRRFGVPRFDRKAAESGVADSTKGFCKSRVVRLGNAPRVSGVAARDAMRPLRLWSPQCSRRIRSPDAHGLEARISNSSSPIRGPARYRTRRSAQSGLVNRDESVSRSAFHSSRSSSSSGARMRSRQFGRLVHPPLIASRRNAGSATVSLRASRWTASGRKIESECSWGHSSQIPDKIRMLFWCLVKLQIQLPDLAEPRRLHQCVEWSTRAFQAGKLKMTQS